MADLHSVLNKYMQDLRENDGVDIQPAGVAVRGDDRYDASDMSPSDAQAMRHDVEARALAHKHAAEAAALQRQQAAERVGAQEMGHQLTISDVIPDRDERLQYLKDNPTSSADNWRDRVDVGLHRAGEWAKEHPVATIGSAALASALAGGAGALALRKRFSKTR